MSWHHGYFSEGPYTSGFYRELAPNWLDFAALVKGQAPPRHEEGQPFRYLELGSGMGFGLCLLAALYPEGQFTGVDFQPDHIAHGQTLAADLGLTNLRFLEADFLALRDDPQPLGFGRSEPGPFHYVVSHGIATWVTQPVQEAMLAVAAAALRGGGLFYCSYNTLPGWQPLSLFQHLAALEAERTDPAQPGVAFARAATTLQALLGNDALPTPLGVQFGALGQELKGLPMDNLGYLCGEYANEGWQPLHVAELHRRAQLHKLTPVATATLPELFEELLPEPIQAVVLQEPNPRIRQTLLDLVTVKRFRRDLFSRGRVNLSRPQWEQRAGALAVRLVEVPPLEEYRFETSFGEAMGRFAVYSRLEETMADGPRCLEQLCVQLELPLAELVRMTALLLDCGRLGFDRGAAGQGALEECRRVNESLQQRMRQGWPYHHLTAPLIGNGVPFNIIEATLVHGFARGWKGEALTGAALARLQALGVSLNDSEGQRLTTETGQRQRLQTLAGTLFRERLPALVALGVLGRPQGGETEMMSRLA